MEYFKILTLLLISFQCVFTNERNGNIEKRMLDIQRRLTALKQDIKDINDKAQTVETNLEENKNSLNEMFSGFTKAFEVNFDGIKEKFNKHYKKLERRKLSKLLQETNEEKDEDETQEQEHLTDTTFDDIKVNLTKNLRYDDFGVVFKASKLAKTFFGDKLISRHRETILFTDIEYNIGDGYNSTTGIFTAPRKGTYLFTVQFYIKYSQRIEAGIFVNGEIPVAVTALCPGNSACYNFEGIANLEEGDLVEVTHLFSNSFDLLDNTFNSNFFSGAMIR